MQAKKLNYLFANLAISEPGTKARQRHYQYDSSQKKYPLSPRELVRVLRFRTL